MSTDAQAIRISGSIPHKAVPSPPAALYLSMSTGGNSQVSTTSTRGGHYKRSNEHNSMKLMQFLNSNKYARLYIAKPNSWPCTERLWLFVEDAMVNSSWKYQKLYNNNEN